MPDQEIQKHNNLIGYSWINYIIVHRNCTYIIGNFSHIYMHELACIHDQFTLQNRISLPRIDPTKPNPAPMEGCCFMSQVTSETDPTHEERGVTSDTVPICDERAWLASSAIYYWKPSVLQCFNGRWSLSGIYLQQVRQKINKLLVGALQVAPQRWFLWDQIFQLTCLLIFNRKWNKKNKYSAEWKLCKEQTTKLLMPKIFIVTVNICCLLG